VDNFFLEKCGFSASIFRIDFCKCFHYNRECNFIESGKEGPVMKMTFQPKKKSHARVHGFRQRMLTANGRKVLSARRAKGRHNISA